MAWQRRQTYIFELDIIGLMPGSASGLAAEYSAWVCRSFTFSALLALAEIGAVEAGDVPTCETGADAEVLVRCVAMARESTSQVEPARRGRRVPTKHVLSLL